MEHYGGTEALWIITECYRSIMEPLWKVRVTIRPGFPGHVLFLGLCPGIWAGFQKLVVCPVFAAVSA